MTSPLWKRAPTAALAALTLSCSGAPEPPPTPAWPDAGLVLRGARLIDASGVQDGKQLLIEDGLITAVIDEAHEPPARLALVELDGAFITPGLVDAHVHLAHSGAPWWVGDTLADNLRATLSWGVVAVGDLGGPTWTFDLRDRLEAGTLLGPRVRAAGPFLTAEGSHPCETGYDRALCRFVDGDGEAQAEALRAEGADFLKAALQDAAFWDAPTPRLDLGELAAICAVDPLTWVHVGADLDAADALDAGCRRLAHVPFGTPAGEEARLPMDAVTSTVSALGGVGRVMDSRDLDEQDFIAVPDAVKRAWGLTQTRPDLLAEGWVEASAGWAAQAQDNLVVYLDAGAPVIAGSDAGYFFVPHGAGLHWELEALVAAGLSPAEALTAATLAPAEALGFDDLGLLAPGYRADLLILDADPLADISALRAPREVWLAGVARTPAELRAADPWRSADDALCLDDRDCGEGEVCDLVDHACAPACEAPFADVESCGPESWCMPADALTTTQGVCHEDVTCDWRAQDCGDFYPETCIPRDLDTSACWPAGERQEGEACAWTDPTVSCAEGLYCGLGVQRCLEICDPAAPSCSAGACVTVEDLQGEAWFGLCQ